LLISIITINLNDLKGLQKTFHSIQNQCYSDFEHLVIDGDSDDGSKEFIKANSHKISFSSSEPDRGVYDAMNKGISRSRGSYLLFLNSGDSFLNENSLQILLDSSNGEDLIYGDLIV
jgi:glycosyltransferase involved in cell wall biosynthesis